MKRGILFVVLALLMILPVVSASLQHGIIGYVQNAEDGTSANGATVTFNVFRGEENYCTLADVVGKEGNSKLANWYAQDMGNCAAEWQAGDIVYANIEKGSTNMNVSFVLTANGSDQMPSIRWDSSGMNSRLIILFVIIVLLAIVIIYILIKRKQKFKNENSLEQK